MPPLPTTFELSIFGAGIGEALAVHLGDNEWLLVDSCLDHRSGRPAALAYLSSLGISPDAVSNILVTHWHEDHVAGIDGLISMCPKARIHFPSAFKSADLYSLVKAGSEKEMFGTDAFQTSRSFAKAIRSLIASKNINGVVPTSVDKILRSKVVTNVGDVKVTALSPSNHAQLLSLQQFREFLEIDLPARRRPVDTDPNHVAIALWIQWGSHRILLGSDLVDTPNANVGWKAAITSQILTGDPLKAIVVKVPHHGSANGHSVALWNKHINANTVGLTTFARGKSPPPQSDDIKRLKKCSQNVFCAPHPVPPKPLKGKATARFAQQQGISVTQRVKRFGHVQIRIDQSGIVDSKCFGDARVL